MSRPPRSRWCSGMLALVVGLGGLQAQEEAESLETAVAEARRDVDEARETLSDLHERIRSERLGLVDRIEGERNATESLREERNAVLDETDAVRLEIEELRAELESLKRLEAFVGSATTEYRQAFETRLGPADAERLRDRLALLDEQLGNPEESLAPSGLTALLEASIAHSREGIGGVRYSGQALAADGLKTGGAFAQFGPIPYFSADAAAVSGLAVQRVGSVLPTVFGDFEPEEAAEITSLVESGRGTVPVDVTLGFGVRLRESRETVWEHIEKGGITVIPLFALAGVCSVLALYKTLALTIVATTRARDRVVEIVSELHRGREDAALGLAARLRKPLGPVIRQGIEHRDAPKEHLEEILYEQIIAQIPRLERFLTPLAVCASAAPLLGLLGTVTGMIHTFRLITVFGTGDARLLSSGISEALVTTELGLMIAIPALLIHAFLSRRVRRTIAITQETAVIFVNGLKLGTGGPRAGDKEAADTP